MSAIAKLSVAEYERIVATGVFDGRNKRRIELIWGELRETSPIGSEHATIVDWLNEWSVDNAPRDRVRVRVQNPVAFLPEDSEPQPDVVWAKRQNYSDHHPTADEILLLVEVADSSLDSDRDGKGKLYAAAGVLDYWIVNLVDRTVEVHRDPKKGRYQNVQSFATGASIQPLAIPDLRLSVDSLFGSLV
jgi:Uma2 family endonuclease